MDTKSGISMRALASDSTEAVIDIVGEIGWDVSFPLLSQMVGQIPDTVKRVVFDIYSPGGDVWDGNAIVSLIGNIEQETVARVRVAASMATLIAVAADVREMNANGRWLIHNPWTVAMGDAKTFEKHAKELRDCELEAAQFYSDRTGKSVEEMIDLMNDERWIRADEAKEIGFIDTILDPFKAAEYAAVSKELKADGKWPRGLVDLDEMPEDEGGDNANPNDDGTGDSAEPEPVIEPAPADEPEGEAGTDTDATIEGDPAPAEPEPESDEGEPGPVADPEPEPEPTPEPEPEPEPEPAPPTALDIDTAVAVALADTQKAHTAQIEQLLAAGKKTELARRGLQSELDTTRTTLETERTAHKEQLAQVQADLADTNARLSQLTLGSLTFCPVIETWDEAFKACGGDYEKARKQYPEAYTLYREAQKQGRK